MVKKEFPEVNIVCTGANLGFAKANNIGMKLSQGRYICLVNSDVVVLDNSIDKMCSYMDKHPSIGMLGPRTLNSDLTLQISYEGFPTLWRYFCRAVGLHRIFLRSKLFAGSTMTYFNGDEIRNVDVLYGSFWLVSREALSDVGMLDENFFMYSEDMDWSKRFNEAGWDVIYYSDAEIIHYGGSSSSNAPVRYYVELHRAYSKYWQKHSNRLSQTAFFTIIMFTNILRVIGWGIVYIIFSSRSKNAGYNVKRSIAVIGWYLGVLRSIIDRLTKLSISHIFFIFQKSKNIILRVMKKRHHGTYVILCYHEVTSEQYKKFIRQVDELKRVANPIVAGIKEDLKKGKHNVSITFDDGFQSVLENALPELRKRNIPFMMFIPSGYLGKRPEWIIDRYDTNRYEFIITSEQLRTLPDDIVTIGSHCVTHTNLSHLDEKKVREELVQSKRDLESILKREVNTLTFPYDGYNQKIVEWAKQAGYKRFFSGQSTVNSSKNDEFIMGRISATPDDWFIEFRLKLMGAYQWLPYAISLKNKFYSLFRIKEVL